MNTLCARASRLELTGDLFREATTTPYIRFDPIVDTSLSREKHIGRYLYYSHASLIRALFIKVSQNGKRVQYRGDKERRSCGRHK